MSLTFRFFIPVGTVLAVVLAALTWAVGAMQVRRTERAFEDQLTALAVSSRFMIHSAAADYCRSRGMVFHRVLPDQVSGPGPAGDFERDALRAFSKDPALAFRSGQYRDPDGTPRMYVLAPAKLQDECASCHAASGMNAFKGRRNGDLVGAFGVSISTQGLRRSEAHTRLMAAAIGLGALGMMALVLAYFVRRRILRPLAGLSGAIARMAQGDLTVRTPVTGQDEIGRLGESFNRMVAQLHRANQDYMEVLAFVSHELKNPIASMITDARLLADGYLGPVAPAQTQKLERLCEVGGQLLELVREYLDLARIEGGNLALRPRLAPFLGEVADPAADLILPQIQARGMTLERRHPAGAEPVQCDPALLKIVLVNLLGNAMKYGREGGSILLSVEQSPSRLRVTVWNQGPGFSAADRDLLFRKFSRLHNPELKETKGTGIGLYTAWHIVQLHGGVMDARSEPGQWAEFSFEIPRPLPPPPAPEAPTDASLRRLAGLDG
jgi:signal transduction histidine kinase/nitrogen fixation-related uncharacterized protein